MLLAISTSTQQMSRQSVQIISCKSGQNQNYGATQPWHTYACLLRLAQEGPSGKSLIFLMPIMFERQGPEIQGVRPDGKGRQDNIYLLL